MKAINLKTLYEGILPGGSFPFFEKAATAKIGYS
jgi:hypothetical protein